MDKHRVCKDKWRSANKERIKEYNKNYGTEWREKNKDKIRTYNASYRTEHLQEAKIYSKAYRDINRKQIAKNQVEYRKENAEKLKARSAARYAANRDAMRKALDAWRAENPEKARAAGRIQAHNRRARIKNNGGELSRDIVSKLLALQRGKCAVCKERLKKTGSHLDHIVPLVKGGKNADSNVQLTCPKCNWKKCAKDPIQFMQEMGYLL